jgi:hypothetical protein
MSEKFRFPTSKIFPVELVITNILQIATNINMAINMLTMILSTFVMVI